MKVYILKKFFKSYFYNFPRWSSVNSFTFRFLILGGKWCVQILLEERGTGDSLYIYINRWKLAQYPAGLIVGANIRVTDVRVKRSKKNNVYLVSTSFTRILHSNLNSEWYEFLSSIFRAQIS